MAGDTTMLKVTQIKSTIGNKRPARESVRSLGLKRIQHSVVVPDNAVNRGYIRSATHLLSVVEIQPVEEVREGNDQP